MRYAGKAFNCYGAYRGSIFRIRKEQSRSDEVSRGTTSSDRVALFMSERYISAGRRVRFSGGIFNSERGTGITHAYFFLRTLDRESKDSRSDEICIRSGALVF